MKKHILIILLAILLSNLSGQNNWKNFYGGQLVSSFYEDGDTVWVCTPTILYKHIKSTNQRQLFDLKRNLFAGQINGVVKDNANSLWIATSNGLFKYSGGLFTSFTPSNSSIPSTTVTCIAYDASQDIVWTGCNSTTSSDVSLVAHNSGNFTAYTVQSGQFMSGIYINNNGHITGCTYQGVFDFNGSTASYIAGTPYANYNCCFSPNGRMMVLSTNGNVHTVFEYDGSVFNQLTVANCVVGPSGQRPFCYDQHKNRWLCTSSGLVKLDTLNNQTTYDNTNSSLSISAELASVNIDQQDHIWLGFDTTYCKTDLSAINYFSTRTINNKNFGAEKMVGNSYGEKAAQDPGFSKGIIVMTDTMTKHLESPYSYTACVNDFYRTVAYDKLDHLWMASECALEYYDGQNIIDTTHFVTPLDFNTETINCIYIDSKNRKWVGTTARAFCYSDSAWVIYSSTNSSIPNAGIMNFTEDKSGNIWAILRNGSPSTVAAAKFDGTNWTAYFTSNSGWGTNDISTIDFTNDGKIWFAVSNGVITFDGTTWTPIPISGLLQSLKVDQNDRVWAACLDKIGYYENGTWSFYTDHNSAIYGEPAFIYTDASNNKWFTNGGSNIFCMVYNENGISNINAPNINYRHLKGCFFNDLNANKVKDTNEPGIANAKVIAYPNGIVGFTNSSGNFDVSVQASTYTLQPVLSNMTLTTDSAQYKAVVLTGDIDSLDFGINFLQQADSIALSLTGSNTKCDEDVFYWIDFTNAGTASTGGTLKFIKSSIVPYSQTGTAVISGDTALWQVSSLAPGEHRQYSLSLTMPNYTFSGTQINNSALFKSNTTNKSAFLSQQITCSFDPNLKSVLPLGWHMDSLSDKKNILEYTIHFQNTGTDTATNIRIADDISPKLDLSTFNVVASSFPYSITQNGRILQFNFEHINLPDSGANFALSQGFIKYRVTPYNNLANNTVVSNSANIYFDNNPPVITNTTRTYMTIYTGINENAYVKSDLSVFPNPASDEITVRCNTHLHGSFTITLSDLLGQTYSKVRLDSESLEKLISVKDLPTGCYILNISGNNVTETFKVIVQR